MGFWRMTKAGYEMSRPSSEHGIHVNGPLTSEDWRTIMADIAEEMCEQAKREGAEECAEEMGRLAKARGGQ